ncbi:uncharacterized protein LOC141665786 [Apium graveolens]|uniref:uncharacterized protein LOC141665786 n=1 Tax=Apium graveolens TaxID=4045 RepID=UPI003D79A30C
MEKKLDTYNQKQEMQYKKVEDTLVRLMQSIDEIRPQLNGASTSQNHRRERNGDGEGIVTETGTNQPFKFTPKLDFPKFDGINPRNWITKCNRYFELCKIANNQKVNLASLYMIDKAETWVSSYLAVRTYVEWDDFIIDLIARFRDDGAGNIVEQFNKMQQVGILYFGLLYWGIKVNCETICESFKPSNISEAIDYARLKEESLAVSYKTAKPNTVYSSHILPKTTQTIPLLANTTPPLLPTPQIKPNPPVVRNSRNFKFIPADVRAEKIAKGLCYYFEVPSELINEEVEEFVGNEDLSGEVFVNTEQLEPYISVNALAGNQNFQTMRLKGISTRNSVHILVDSGNTHNFLDFAFAKKLGCKLEEVTAQAVTVADGNSIVCKCICRNFEWMINGKKFQTDVMLIPLGSCDMVLGIQWLSTLGPVYWDFSKLKMSFIVNDEHISLRGIPHKKLKVLEGGPSEKLLKSASHCCLIQVKQLPTVYLESTLVSADNNECLPVSKVDSKELNKLKDKFASVFEEPRDLPPQRGRFDHKIPLTPGEGPVNIRPYSYPLKKRDIIEQLIQEMLERGIIQDSSSPFAYPVVLVGKKDGTWRLCVDYKEFNRKTIKDKFPIPVIDELIDELAGAEVFSKLDLRSGYHQLRLHPDDIFKTAFKTHTGHCEFLVMPLGLTNAPASFQGWMNAAFKPLLRKCVLVFFDDVLIEYLGQFISSKGVETDPQKISAITCWQVPKTIKEFRGFLGLVGYYRKFIKGYALLSKPLINFLKTGAFQWTKEAQHSFEQLKNALSIAPVLAVPNFDIPFEIETDASQFGIGAVLMQKGHPLAFISRALGPKWQKLPVYEKELLAIVFSVQKWEQYLSSGHFIIRTDQKSLRWLLQQKVSTPFQ